MRQKTSLNLCRSFCLISLATNILEGWDIIHLKGEVHSSDWSTLLCTTSGSWDISKTIWDIRFQGARLSNIYFFKIWYPILICLYLRFLIVYIKVFVFQTKLWISPFKWIISQPFSMFVAREIKQKLRHKFIELFCLTL